MSDLIFSAIKDVLKESAKAGGDLIPVVAILVGGGLIAWAMYLAYKVVVKVLEKLVRKP